MSKSIEDLRIPTAQEGDSSFTQSHVIATKEQQSTLLSARIISDSTTIEKNFGMLALKDVNADKLALEKLYDDVAPSEQSKKDFADRLALLTKDNPEFIERMLQASKEQPEKSGATLADALIDVLKNCPTRPADFDNNRSVQAAFGVVASMVRIDGRGDNSAGGAKEQIVEGFNAEILTKGNEDYKSSLVAFKAYVTDSQGNIQHWEDGAPKERHATGSPFLVLYDEPGRAPAAIVIPTDIEAVKFNPEKYTPPKE